MANIGSLIANIGANTSGLNRGLNQAENRMKGFTSKSVVGLRSFASAFGPVTIAATGFAATAALVGAGVAKSISELVKFEDALLDLQKVMKASEGNAIDYIDQVDAMGAAFGKSSAEVLQGAADFKQAGFTIEEAFMLQEKALTATRISELSVAEASELLVRAIKGFKGPASDATKILDGLNEVSNNYATTLTELIRGFAGLSPIARQAGLSMAETAGFLTPIIEVFGSGSEALNALKLSFVRLTSDNQKVIRGLELLGKATGGMAISQTKANGEFKKGIEIMREVQGAFVGLADNIKLPITAMLVGARQAGRMTEVFDQLGKTTAVTATFLGGTGSAMRELGVRMTATGVKIDKMKESFNRLYRDIGIALIPAIDGTTLSLDRLFETIRTSSTMEAFGNDIKVVAGQIRALISIWDALVATVKAPIKVVDFIADKSIDAALAASKAVTDLSKDLLGLSTLGNVVIPIEVRLPSVFPKVNIPQLEIPELIIPGVTLPTIDSSLAIAELDRIQARMSLLTVDVIAFGKEMAAATRLPAEQLAIDLDKIQKAVAAGAFDEFPEAIARSVVLAQEKFEAGTAAMVQTVEQLRDPLQSAADSLTQSLLTPFEAMQERLSEIKEFLDKGLITPEIHKRAIAEVQEAFENASGSMREEAAALTLSLRTPFEVMRDEMQKVSDFADEGLIDVETQTRAIKKIENDYCNSVEEMQECTSEWGEFAKNIFVDLGKSLQTIVFDVWETDMNSFDEAFKTFLNGLVSAALDAFSQSFATDVLDPFFNSLFGGSGTPATTGGTVGTPTGSPLNLPPDTTVARTTGTTVSPFAGIGGQAGFNATRIGSDGASSDGGLTINVPVNIQGHKDNALAGELQKTIEKAVNNIIRTRL
jgi:TP901 family phage tail tape measure protein